MAGTINPQDAAENVIAVLTAGMAAQLSAIDTEYGDGITLPTVDNYWRSPQTQYPAALNIVVVPAETEPDNSPDQLQTHQLVLEMILTEGSSNASYSTTELVTIKLWRIVRAIQELLNKTTLSGSVNQCFVVSAQATELGQDGRRFEQRAEIELLIQIS